MQEIDSGIAVVTETWMKDGEGLTDQAEDLSLGAGVGIAHRNRNMHRNGVAYGGVAVLWQERLATLKKLTIEHADYEVLVVGGSVKGLGRKVLVVACYLPPNLTPGRAEQCMDFISDAVMEGKRRYKDPLVFVAGDFNQWHIEDYLMDYGDLREVQVGPTRGGRSIDRIFCNGSRMVTEAGTLEPLETEEGSKSDHKVAFCKLAVLKHKTFRWETYTYRRYTVEAEEAFKNWIVFHDWAEVYQAHGSNDKTRAYQNTLAMAVDSFFPLKTTRRKSTDLPWMTKGIQKLIKNRKRLYVAEGGDSWREEKQRIEDIIKTRKRSYMDNQKEHLLAKDASRIFFKHVKNFAAFEKPPVFDVRSLLPGRTDMEVATCLAEYFNKVSREFDPLEPSDIPFTKDSGLPTLREFEVAKRIKTFRKPKSMVPGDIFPDLMTKFSDFFALPLTDIYNEITRSSVWPLQWKREFVTVIPKKNNPESLGDLRNISCTPVSYTHLTLPTTPYV